MSINHFSTDLQETPWSSPQQQEPTQQHKVHLPNPQQLSSWPSHNLFQHHHQHQAWLNSYNSQESSSSPSMFQSHHHQVFSFNPNRLDYNGQEQQEGVEEQASSVNTREEQEGELEKEPMFEKPLTPSDVGKLNRLVIPKQHAEKYFPLGGGGSESGDKGLLLSFEDESGKCWRFRYSYWNSSQSYVLTKGWSRYVKEKRLDAGDIILFERHRTDGKRFFIRWRRRGATVAQDSHGGNGSGSGGGWSRGLYLASTNPYPGDCLHAGSVVQNPVGNSKTLRLFGVNVECQLGDESAEASTPNGSPMSSQGQGHGQQQQQFNYNYSQAYSSNRHNHMDITFSQDVNQMMRNSQG